MRKFFTSRRKTVPLFSFFLILFLLPMPFAQANPSSLAEVSTKTKNSLSQADFIHNFLEYETIIVPSNLCENAAKTTREYEKVEKQKIKKTSWYPYHNIGKTKKYKKYKKNSTVCVATYESSYPPIAEYNEVPGAILFSFFEDKNCIDKAEKILSNKNWKELGSPKLVGCLLLGQNISPKEAMKLVKHPSAKYVEYDAILTIN